MESSNLLREKGKQDNSNGVTYSDSSSLSARVITDNLWQLSKLSNSFLTFHYKVALELERCWSCWKFPDICTKYIQTSEHLLLEACRLSIFSADLLPGSYLRSYLERSKIQTVCKLWMSLHLLFSDQCRFSMEQVQLGQKWIRCFKEFVGFYCFPSHCFSSSD